MSEESTEPDIERLLAALRSGDGPQRKEAAELIAQKKINNPQLVSELERLSSSDPLQYVQYTATQTLKKLGYTDQKPGYPEKPPERQLTRNEKIRDFVIGFMGWYILTRILWFIINPGLNNGGISILGVATGILSFLNNGGSSISLIIGILSFPLNLIVLIVFASIKRTHWIGLGILVALALNLVVSLIIGAVFNALCFVPFYVK
jgi:hypothetical protein